MHSFLGHVRFPLQRTRVAGRVSSSATRGAVSGSSGAATESSTAPTTRTSTAAARVSLMRTGRVRVVVNGCSASPVCVICTVKSILVVDVIRKSNTPRLQSLSVGARAPTESQGSPNERIRENASISNLLRCIHYNESCTSASHVLGCVSEKPECGPGQFVCDNEHCIGMSKVCNGVDECSDGSDERECSKFAHFLGTARTAGAAQLRSKTQRRVLEPQKQRRFCCCVR